VRLRNTIHNGATRSIESNISLSPAGTEHEPVKITSIFGGVALQKNGISHHNEKSYMDFLSFTA
jgi:hypothetical protein